MYNYKKIAQQTYDPDSPDEPLDLSEVETVEMEPTEEQNEQDDLPEVTQEDVMSKMEDQTEEIEQQEPEVETEEPEGYPKFPNAFQAARWAKHNKQILRITYRTEKGHVIIRDVEPHGDFYAKTTHRRILVTYDRSIDDIRAFTVDRIQDFKFTGEEFTPRFNFSATRRNYLRRRKRKQRKILPFKRTSMENQIENIVKIASAAEDKGLLKQASALDSISKKMVMTKFAQYVGIQGYWIKNERCWSNCYRQKRATSKKAAQEVWVECQREYADSINNPKSTWSKYANEVAPLTKFASSNHEKVAGKIIATEKEYFETKVAEKVAGGLEYHTAVYNTIQERSDKYAESQIDLATEMLKVADSLYDNGMQKEASDLALEANELMKEAQFGNMLQRGWGKARDFMRRDPKKVLLSWMTNLRDAAYKARDTITTYGLRSTQASQALKLLQERITAKQGDLNKMLGEDPAAQDVLQAANQVMNTGPGQRTKSLENLLNKIQPYLVKMSQPAAPGDPAAAKKEPVNPFDLGKSPVERAAPLSTKPDEPVAPVAPVAPANVSADMGATINTIENIAELNNLKAILDKRIQEVTAKSTVAPTGTGTTNTAQPSAQNISSPQGQWSGGTVSLPGSTPTAAKTIFKLVK